MTDDLILGCINATALLGIGVVWFYFNRQVFQTVLHILEVPPFSVEINLVEEEDEKEDVEESNASEANEEN